MKRLAPGTGTGGPNPLSTIHFSAEIKPKSADDRGWVAFLESPKEAARKLPAQQPVPVEGVINGFPFRLNWEPDGSQVIVNEAILGGAGAKIGDRVTVEITRVGDEPEVRLPGEFRNALARVQKAQDLWTSITPMARRDWILWMVSARQAETRLGRMEKACDMLASGKKRVCCFGGLNWLLKDHGASGGKWLALPK